MSLPSIFKQKTDQRSFDTTANYPAATTGFLVSTADIIAINIDKNPYFQAVNRMSQSEVDQYLEGGTKYSQLKGGVSVMHKAPGAIRDVKTYINPKAIDMISGGAEGKLSAVNVGKGDVHTGEMINIGGRTITPIVIGVTSNGGAKPNPGSGENTPVEAAMAGEIAPKPLKPDVGAIFNPFDPTGFFGGLTNYLGKNISTGTTKESNKSVVHSSAINPNIPTSSPPRGPVREP